MSSWVPGLVTALSLGPSHLPSWTGTCTVGLQGPATEDPKTPVRNWDSRGGDESCGQTSRSAALVNRTLGCLAQRKPELGRQGSTAGPPPRPSPPLASQPVLRAWRRALSDWSGVDPWAASLRGDSRAHRAWAMCSRPGLPGAHVQAPGQTQHLKCHLTHRLTTQSGNTWFLGIWNLAFLRPFPWPSPFWAAVSPPTPPPETCGSQEPPQDLSYSAAPTVVQPLRGAAPPHVVNKGTCRGKAPARRSGDSCTGTATPTPPSTPAHAAWFKDSVFLIRASEIPSVLVEVFWNASAGS